MADRYWAMRVETRDMHPRIYQNEVVVYDAEEVIRPGDDIAIELLSGGWIFRSLVSFDDVSLRLKTYQPAAASTLPRDKVKACYPIVARMKEADFLELTRQGEARCEPS